MKLHKILLTVLFLAAVGATAPMAGNYDNQSSAPPQAGDRDYRASAPQPMIHGMDNQEKGPAFSAPQETMHENGDRVSHYPPYYRPEGSFSR